MAEKMDIFTGTSVRIQENSTHHPKSVSPLRGKHNSTKKPELYLSDAILLDI